MSCTTASRTWTWCRSMRRTITTRPAGSRVQVFRQHVLGETDETKPQREKHPPRKLGDMPLCTPASCPITPSISKAWPPNGSSGQAQPSSREPSSSALGTEWPAMLSRKAGEKFLLSREGQSDRVTLSSSRDKDPRSCTSIPRSETLRPLAPSMQPRRSRPAPPVAPASATTAFPHFNRTDDRIECRTS